MKRNLAAAMILAAGTLSAQYPSRDRYDDRAYDDRYDNRGYDNRGNGNSDYDAGYNAGYNAGYSAGYEAPPPPAAPAYGVAYRRPPMPGPNYLWVDSCWNFRGGRYVWSTGYWAPRPFAGAYWVAPRYNSGRFFVGYWGGGGRGRAGVGYSHGGNSRHGYRR